MSKDRFNPEELKYDGSGLIPAVVRCASTGDVLMLAYMNLESLHKTIETGQTWFYSRSRQQLWHKGATSGNVQRVKAMRTDCDQDALLIEVEQVGDGACHEGDWSCFHYGVDGVADSSADLEQVRQQEQHIVDVLYQVILDRKNNPKEGSYTTYLFNEGVDKILKKVGEENTEVLIAAKDDHKQNVIAETADLLYHLLVLLAELNIKPTDVWRELGKRRGGGGNPDTPPGK